MKTLIVGGGAREHALAWALARHGHAVRVAPGNAGIARAHECAPVRADDVAGQVGLALDGGVDLVVCGPEAPLVAGLADALAARGVPCFGPSRAGAQLEGSKAFAKQLFARHGVPTAEFALCASAGEVDAALARLGGMVVVKADGLAAGKGVVVCGGADEARAAARRMLDGVLGEAGRRVVIERRLAGREASVLAVTDGVRLAILPPAEDHKALLDGDRGPNTGGMGAVSPTPVVTPEVLGRVEREVLRPTLAGLAAEGISYRGVLYAGLMIAADGTPNLLEYNCRLGDPEAEVILPRWAEADDPAALLLAAATGALPPAPALPVSPRAAVCVVMTAEGYPGAPRAGDAIAGLEAAEALEDVMVFHAGTRVEGGRIVTAGGRVLAVTAMGETAPAARERAYLAVSKVTWEGVHYRRDIGLRRGAA